MEIKKFLQSVVEILKGKDLFENLDVHGRIKLEKVWIGFIWLRTWSTELDTEPSGSITGRKMSRCIRIFMSSI